MIEKELKQQLEELIQLSDEGECVEFKEAKNTFDFQRLGKYFSALSNEANLKHKEYSWLVFGINKHRQIVGSQYRPNRASLDSLKHEISQHVTYNITFNVQ